MSKRVLLVAFHYPPNQDSSGHLRVLGFARYLSEYGWDPLVLTVWPSAYRRRGELPSDLPDVPIRRAFGVDVRSTLSIRGRYPGFMAIPDRWGSWWLGGVPAGLALIRRYRPAALWSTFPIATTSLIAQTLQRRSGLPWIADYRDPMNPTNTFGSAWRARIAKRIDRATAKRCARAVFTTPGAAALYAERYPDRDPAHWRVIANGYDEESFHGLTARQLSPRPDPPLRFLHSGILYKGDRDPVAFLEALNRLLKTGEIARNDIRVVFRASDLEGYLEQLIQRAGLGDMVEFAPALAHRDALAEMLAADALLLFQGSAFNRQIPAKIYEYIRARRPVLALVDPEGDTAGALHKAGIDSIAPMDQSDWIVPVLKDFIAQVRAGTASTAGDEHVASHSRRARAGELGKLLDEITTQE